MKRILYLNGRFVAASAASVSAEDRGLLYGDGLFETVRIYHGRPFALDRHLWRLRQAGERVRMRIPGSRRWWEAILSELLRRNRLDGKDAAVRVTITRGVGGVGLLPPRRTRQTILASANRISSELGEWQRRGVAVVLLPFSPGSDAFLTGIKTTDYLTALIGKAMARERDAFEGIYCSRDGRVLEGTTTNVFVIHGKQLLAPPVESGILPGITRAQVLRIARRIGLEPHERAIRIRDLELADEAFLTASTIEIVPIATVDRKPIGLRGHHPKTDELRRLFHRLATGARR
ncbi:MAG: aminotransferase class IV [Candidatus Binatia bacterium]